jgi:hypothetical protein
MFLSKVVEKAQFHGQKLFPESRAVYNVKICGRIRQATPDII